MKRTAIAIVIAVVVVSIGAALVFAGLSAIHFDFKKLDRTEYMTNTYDFEGPIRELEVEGRTADVALLPAEDGKCRVVCFENERNRYAVTADQGRLTIRPQGKGSGWNPFGFSFKSPKITVYLPAGAYDLLQAELGTGDMSAEKGLSFETVRIGMDTGDLSMSGVGAGALVVRGGTGDIRLSDMTPETADLSLSTGRMELTRVVCTGTLTCKSSTGDIRLTDVDGADVYLTATTGDIEGTILTEKVFSAHANTGKVVVPAGTAGGRCEAETSTGDIRLSISGK